MLVNCAKCDARVDANPSGGFKVWNEEEGPPARYTLLKCPSCAGPILVVQEEYAQDEYTEPRRIFPTEAGFADPTWPLEVQESFVEAVKCLRVRALHAAAVMCRRTLEIVSIALGVKDGTLNDRLKLLREQGHIEDRLLEWAHGLRIVGNIGAHATNETVSMLDAQDAVEFTKALSDYVFTFRARFEAFKARRAGRTGKPK